MQPPQPELHGWALPDPQRNLYCVVERVASTDEFLLVLNGRVLASFVSVEEILLFQDWVDSALADTGKANAMLASLLTGDVRGPTSG